MCVCVCTYVYVPACCCCLDGQFLLTYPNTFGHLADHVQASEHSGHEDPVALDAFPIGNKVPNHLIGVGMAERHVIG